MATATIQCPIAQIGETAGLVWQCLDQSGPLLISKLIKQVDAPRDAVMQAVGWLAREGKIELEEIGRGKKIISLL